MSHSFGWIVQHINMSSGVQKAKPKIISFMKALFSIFIIITKDWSNRKIEIIVKNRKNNSYYWGKDIKGIYISWVQIVGQAPILVVSASS